jgi:hypothetical protein
LEQLPLMVRVRQTLPANEIKQPEEATYREMSTSLRHAAPIQGTRIAVGCGSRGIACYAQIVRGVIRALQDVGAQPFIFPAMGSHGGATAEGQKEVLASAGITEEQMGVPIHATMETVEIGRLPNGPTVYFDRHAAQADGIVVVNRVKPHTDFTGDFASGLIKMLVIGCGKEKGAQAVHAYGVYGLRELIPQMAEIILAELPILPGMAIVENPHDQPAVLRALASHEMIRGEKELLTLARNLMGRLPVDSLDVLVLDEMGKNISGSGIDTNVIGRLYIAGEAEYETPGIRRIVVLDLTAESHGNAVGIGLADVITQRLRSKIDENATYINAVTSTFLERGRIPVTLPTDLAAITTAFRCAWRINVAEARVVRAKNSLELADLYVSTAVWEELASKPGMQQLSEPLPWRFDDDGNLAMPW